MKKLDERTMANLDVVLEEACRNLPHGGDHAFRKRIAQRLLSTARSGKATLGRLSAVARDMVSGAHDRESAYPDAERPRS
jgi:hypothetical protein